MIQIGTDTCNKSWLAQFVFIQCFLIFKNAFDGGEGKVIIVNLNFTISIKYTSDEQHNVLANQHVNKFYLY
jgi:hypothetical protein